MRDLIGRTIGHYRIVDKIGEGGMGEVYRAHAERFDRDVAVKVLPTSVAQDPERIARFEREAKAAAKLEHPNILAIYDFGTGDDVTYSATELLEGETLRERLDDAVRRFQARHGLDADGVVGNDTIQELNLSVGERIQQIVVNLERWRWLPQTLGRRHVPVNIVGFDLRAVNDEAPVLSMRAIVGRTYRRRPVFSDLISYMVLNPS